MLAIAAPVQSGAAKPLHAINGGAIRTHPDQDPLALDVDVSDGQLAGERHFGGKLASRAKQESRC